MSVQMQQNVNNQKIYMKGINSCTVLPYFLQCSSKFSGFKVFKIKTWKRKKETQERNGSFSSE